MTKKYRNQVMTNKQREKYDEQKKSSSEFRAKNEINEKKRKIGREKRKL